MENDVMITKKNKLPLVDVESELRAFEEAEKKRLGITDEVIDHWVEDMAGLSFTKREKSGITMLVGGLTMAHDYFVEAGLKGVGYNVQRLDVPDNAALQYGKEYGNRGQCNPTYFTVGGLVKFLCTLRDKHGMSSKEIVDKYVFFTAGACGPCRFGMYVTEYRKALRDAGFEGFRVCLFQQKGGLKQATGEESGLELGPKFFGAILKALFAGDVVNAIGYRIRPYEVNVGDTDRVLEKTKDMVYDALLNKKSVLAALNRARRMFRAIPIDRTRVKPKVSIIGEFWAMTTEGDGNYQLQRFLESEGGECDIQLVAAWLLYSVWEGQNDTKDRAHLKDADTAEYGLGKIAADPFGVAKRFAGLHGADFAIRAIFQTFAHAVGLYGYHLPDMTKLATISDEYYNNDLRGGEGHMEVGKLIMNVVESKAHMTLSVKPFGCMPSAGVSDGVQSAITEKFPGTIFCPVETSGDGRVNFYSRVQMYMFKARQAALAEYDRALIEHGVTADQVATFLTKNPRFSNPLHKPPHAYAGVCADIVAEVAPYIKLSRLERAKLRVTNFGKKSVAVAKGSPHLVISVAKEALEEAPIVAKKVAEDVAIVKEQIAMSRAKKKREKASAKDGTTASL
jgi:predicted nucleotide-binding protein (sugar kinase/HSP70/actin superfamily)